VEVLKVSPTHPEADSIQRAAAAIASGGLVAFPTETVYGLGANAMDPAAVRRIFTVKNRPGQNPLIAHVASADDAALLVEHWPASAQRLAERFWPGPLTLVLPKRPSVPDEVTAGLPAVAVRVPAHPVALALLRAAGLPIAAPSANRYTELSPTTAEHVLKALGPSIDFVLDAGPTTVGIESTVLDLTGERALLLRPGMVTVAELEAAIGPVALAPRPREAEPRLSPGMHDRHYAPRARLMLCTAHEAPALIADVGRGKLVGALALGGDRWPVHHPIRMPDDPVTYASRLYAALHALDELGCQIVLVEIPPDAGAWLGVRDRLARAAAPG
jgi:L-threonylcarbamoyladenylate synthase